MWPSRATSRIASCVQHAQDRSALVAQLGDRGGDAAAEALAQLGDRAAGVVHAVSQAAGCSRQDPFRTRQQNRRGDDPPDARRFAGLAAAGGGDGQYATREVVEATAGARSNLVSRIRSDAALYALPPKRKPGQRGASRRRASGLPTPRVLARQRKKGWRLVEARDVREGASALVLSIECLWYHVRPDRPIQLLIVRDPEGQEKDDYLFCYRSIGTGRGDPGAVRGRWPIEESFLQGKQFGGLEQVQGWCARTVLRQAPMALVVQTLVKTWYLLYGVTANGAQPKGTDWQGPRTIRVTWTCWRRCGRCSGPRELMATRP